MNINFNTVPVVSDISANDFIHATIGGQHRRVYLETIIEKAKERTLSNVEATILNKLTSGCFIMAHKLTSNAVVAVEASTWQAKEDEGFIADGVMLIEGGKHLVVAPTHSPTLLPWSSTSTLVGTAITDRITALGDFNGRDKTSSITGNSIIGGDGVGYAAGFCNAYSRVNSAGFGLVAGTWWLPSLGEMMMIRANKYKLNLCLSLIDGADRIKDDAHWTSTESSASEAWYLWTYDTAFKTENKSGTKRVRPVSAYLV